MKKVIYLMFITLFFWGCGHDEDNPVPVNDLNYISLVIEKDTIAAGDEVKVKATATGSQLAYHWSASKGDILGSGAEVVYASSPCHVGKNTITCKVTNGNNQEETKTVDVVVAD